MMTVMSIVVILTMAVARIMMKPCQSIVTLGTASSISYRLTRL